MCFSLAWVENLLIWLVVVCAVVAVVKLILPRVLSPLGEAGGFAMSVLNIIMWAAVSVFVIVICFDLFQCLLSAARR